MTIRGVRSRVCSLVEPLRLAMDNGARRALVPIQNKRDFLEVPGDIMERIGPSFCRDLATAAQRALGL
jgi:ATP-dependent Lon protease